MVIFVMLVSLSLLVGPASAVDLDASMNNQQRQDAINNADPTDYTVNFLTSQGTTYSNVSLTAPKDNVEWIGNGVTLVGGGRSIFTITNRTGLTIKDFIININNDTADGITGNNVYNCTIENNVITNGDDGINIYQRYAGLTIKDNTISNVDRDGISLVNHDVLDFEDFYALDPTIIEDNVIENVVYGVFIGGNFLGDITGNTIGGTTAGLTITGKPTSSNGILDAYIADNTIAGIAMECPEVFYLDLFNNTIGQLGATNYSIQTGGVYGVVGQLFVTFNEFSNNVTQNFIDDAVDTGYWSNNTKNGIPYP
ncbi:MAG: right-handed parallel beta-helix repeat-containing protein [Methanobacteriaceae archaeon]|nr:right-handed parallel beta-helix repeat-containing protein [Methanobacteriaceae archaeon]